MTSRREQEELTTIKTSIHDYETGVRECFTLTEARPGAMNQRRDPDVVAERRVQLMRPVGEKLALVSSAIRDIAQHALGSREQTKTYLERKLRGPANPGLLRPRAKCTPR